MLPVIGVERRLNETIPANFELVRLPPYSCELNPIEFTLNSAKAHIKRGFSQHGPSIHLDATTFASARRQVLLDICQEAIQNITQAD